MKCSGFQVLNTGCPVLNSDSPIWSRDYLIYYRGSPIYCRCSQACCMETPACRNLIPALYRDFPIYSHIPNNFLQRPQSWCLERISYQKKYFKSKLINVPLYNILFMLLDDEEISSIEHFLGC